MKTEKEAVGEYILFLQGKGFPFKEDAIGFIYFGMELADAGAEAVIAAIEITLKIQKRFDGSFYLSLIERFKEQQITTKKEAYHYVKKLRLL